MRAYRIQDSSHELNIEQMTTLEGLGVVRRIGDGVYVFVGDFRPNDVVLYLAPWGLQYHTHGNAATVATVGNTLDAVLDLLKQRIEMDHDQQGNERSHGQTRDRKPEPYMAAVLRHGIPVFRVFGDAALCLAVIELLRTGPLRTAVMDAATRRLADPPNCQTPRFFGSPDLGQV